MCFDSLSVIDKRAYLIESLDCLMEVLPEKSKQLNQYKTIIMTQDSGSFYDDFYLIISNLVHVSSISKQNSILLSYQSKMDSIKQLEQDDDDGDPDLLLSQYLD